MAWYPGARRMELQPESDNQPAIVPDQFIAHSVAAPWNEQRIGEYWAQPGINLESHFGLDYDGSIGQYIGTQTRADANAGANRRANGHGAVSIETASNAEHTDPWTPEQIEQLIRLGVWLHHEHGIPLRICRTWDDPGYGYHGLFPEWSLGGTACPGPARIKQFRERVFPGIVARASGQEEDDMPYTPEQIGSAVANADLPVYDQAGKVIGQAKLYEYLGGFKLANERQDKALAELSARVGELAGAGGVTQAQLEAAAAAGARAALLQLAAALKGAGS